jgi:ribosomal protein S18 acetylase RimI-like enzyme
MQSAAVTIRVGSVTDVDRVAPLFDAYRQFYGEAPGIDRTRAFLAERQTLRESVLLVAVTERPDGTEDVIGFAQLYPSFSSVSLARVMILNDLFVLPECRRTRVARSLVSVVIDHTRRAGAIRVELSTQHANSPARELYRTLGFEEDRVFTHLGLDVGVSTPVP